MSDPHALDRLATIHSLLGSPTRLAFVQALASGPKSGTMLGELTGVSLSAVSQHMGKLKEGGLVGWSRDQKRRQIILFHLIEPHHPLVAASIGLLLPATSPDAVRFSGADAKGRTVHDSGWIEPEKGAPDA